MDAFIDMDIAEMELLMESQDQTPDGFVFQGDVGTFTPELFLSNGNAAYAPDTDPFEAEWLALQLAPDTLMHDEGATKPDSIFSADDEDDDEIIVSGTRFTSGGSGFAGFISTSSAMLIQAHLAAQDNHSPEDEIIVLGQLIPPSDGDGTVFVSHSDGSIGVYAYIFDVFGYPQSDDGIDFEIAENELEDLLFDDTGIIFTVEWDEVNGVFIAQGPAF